MSKHTVRQKEDEVLTKFLNNSHETLNNKRNGFAITFEIMMVGLLVTFATIVIVYFSEVMNTQRFMYDLTASTCTAAARYGGNDSRAYEFQVRQSNPNASATSISDNANKYIQAIAKRTDQITGAESFVFEGAGEGGNYLTVSDSPEGGYV